MLSTYLEQEEAATVMFTLADQDKAWDFALKRERAEGEITGAVKLYRDEMGLSPAVIAERLTARFALTREEAEKYVDEVLGVTV